MLFLGVPLVRWWSWGMCGPIMLPCIPWGVSVWGCWGSGELSEKLTLLHRVCLGRAVPGLAWAEPA